MYINVRSFVPFKKSLSIRFDIIQHIKAKYRRKKPLKTQKKQLEEWKKNV